MEYGDSKPKFFNNGQSADGSIKYTFLSQRLPAHSLIKGWLYSLFPVVPLMWKYYESKGI